MKLSSKQRRNLRAQAHDLDAVARVGKDGLTPQVIEAVNQALGDHELIKVRFVDHKDERDEIAEEMARQTSSRRVGQIGNIVILYRRNPDPEKRKISI